jgi:hypothetical protein
MTTASSPPPPSPSPALPPSLPLPLIHAPGMKFTLQCRTCFAQFRLQRIGIVTAINNDFYCPSCGNSAGILQDSQLDYLETLADAFGLTPELIKQLYELWDWTEHPSFGDFVRSMQDAPS